MPLVFLSCPSFPLIKWLRAQAQHDQKYPQSTINKWPHVALMARMIIRMARSRWMTCYGPGPWTNRRKQCHAMKLSAMQGTALKCIAMKCSAVGCSEVHQCVSNSSAGKTWQIAHIYSTCVPFFSDPYILRSSYICSVQWTVYREINGLCLCFKAVWFRANTIDLVI